MQQLFEPLIPYSQYHDYLSQKYAAASAVDEGSFRRLLKELEDAISTLLIQIISQDDDGSVNHYYDALKVLVVMYGRIQETQTALSSSTSVGANSAVTTPTSNTTGVNVGSFQRVGGGVNVNGSAINGNGIGTVESSVLQLSDSNMLNVNTPTTLGSVNGPYTKDYSATTLATGLTANNNGGSYTSNLGNSSNQIHTHIHRHNSTAFNLLERNNSIGNASNQLLNASNAGVNSAENGNSTAIPATGVEGLELNDMYDPVSVPSHHSLTASGLLHQQSQQHQNPQVYHRQQQHQLPNHQQHSVMSLPMGSPQQHPQQQHHHLQTSQQHPHHHPQQLQQQQQTYYYPMNYNNSTTATQNPSPNADSSHSGVGNTNNSSANNLRYYQQSQGSSSGVSHGSTVATSGHSNGASTGGNADYNQQYFYTLQRYPYLPPIPSQHHSGSSTGNHGTSSSISLGNGNSGSTTNVPNGVNMNGASGTAAGPGSGTGFQNYLLDFNFTS